MPLLRHKQDAGRAEGLLLAAKVRGGCEEPLSAIRRGVTAELGTEGKGHASQGLNVNKGLEVEKWDMIWNSKSEIQVPCRG